MKITNAMIDAAEKRGKKVTELKDIPKPGSKQASAAPAPAPAQTNLEPLTGAIGELVDSLQAQLVTSQNQLTEAQNQNEELRALVTAAHADKPVRLKPVRDMDPNSRTYLLIEYIDVIPVTYTKKLN